MEAGVECRLFVGMSLSDKPLVGRWCVGFGMGRLSEVTFPFVVRLS